MRLAAAVLVAGTVLSHAGRADQSAALQWLFAQAAPGPENQVCFTDKEGRRHYCPAGALCCRAAKTGCCAAGSLCTDYGCALALRCSVCADGMQRSVQLHVKTPRGLRTYVSNEIARYANCKKKVGGDCTAGDLLVRTLGACNQFADQAAYHACIERSIGPRP